MVDNELRFEVDGREESLARRVRDAEVQKIPVCLIIGDKELRERSVTIRSKAGEQRLPLDSLKKVLMSIENSV